MKIFLLLMLLFFSVTNNAQPTSFGDAKGLFMSLGVGPKFPVGNFSDKNNIGVGAETSLLYTDNLLVPFFFYSTLGYQHYPGKQTLYKKTDYASYSSNMIFLAAGIRYYFPPLVENVALLMPLVDAGIQYSYFENSHIFKEDKNRQNFTEGKSKFGFQIGGGFSMFILDVMTYYNYLPDNQYLSFVFKATIPIFVKI
ncbi:hypothetical protein [Melioribacter sp. OK-6-Me]|uniref:hypothetical protein n=1 Tax=unclassified Melioribacter TaxID=2627329 RepID=UPI003EDA75F5